MMRGLTAEERAAADAKRAAQDEAETKLRALLVEAAALATAAGEARMAALMEFHTLRGLALDAEKDAEARAADFAGRAAWETRRGIVDDIKERIASGELEDSDDVNDAVHEACDSACTYTSDQYVLAWGLSDADDEFDDAGGVGSDWSGTLARRAYWNLHAEVMREDFDAVLEEKREADEAREAEQAEAEERAASEGSES